MPKIKAAVEQDYSLMQYAKGLVQIAGKNSNSMNS
jgi:hypothetical protein